MLFQAAHDFRLPDRRTLLHVIFLCLGRSFEIIWLTNFNSTFLEVFFNVNHLLTRIKSGIGEYIVTNCCILAVRASLHKATLLLNLLLSITTWTGLRWAVVFIEITLSLSLFLSMTARRVARTPLRPFLPALCYDSKTFLHSVFSIVLDTLSWVVPAYIGRI